jgi:hypothetical protein
VDSLGVPGLLGVLVVLSVGLLGDVHHLLGSSVGGTVRSERCSIRDRAERKRSNRSYPVILISGLVGL